MVFNFASSNSIARKLKQIKEKTIYSHTSCCGDLEEDDEAVESAELLWWVSSWFKYSRALSPDSTQVTATTTITRINTNIHELWINRSNIISILSEHTSHNLKTKTVFASKISKTITFVQVDQ